jgi:hypothetical protein
LIMDCFGSSEGQEWQSASDSMAVIRYRKFQTVFLLELFSSVFTQFDIFCFVYCKQKV